MNSVSFKVEGMHCMNCEAKIKNELAKTDGVVGVYTSLEEKSVTVTHDGRSGMEDAAKRGIEAIDDNKFTVVGE